MGETMIDEMKLTDIERDLIEGMEGFLDDLRKDAPIREKYTCRRVVIDLRPTTYTPEQVKATRNLLGVSQAVFAQFLGVSKKTVAAWEQGRLPNEMACRFMDEIQHNPEYWRERLRTSVRSKTAYA